ncbi:hypothetical protein GCM10017673_56190 [Streptosporangium violaceochromogenes]|nr:hypothetical protein GCM10017673_56190 [Streptosporangium violaceochromogenes]
MRDKSRISAPQPPNDRSTDVKSVANISIAVSNVGSIIVGAITLVIVAVGRAVVGDSVISVGVSDGVPSVSIGFVGEVVVAAAAVGVGVGGSIIVNSVAFMTFIGNAVRGVSRLRLTLRQTRVAAPLAVAVWIGGRSRRWQAEPWEVDLTTSPRPIRYSLGLVVAATRMRLYDLGGLLVKVARWVLASNRRTWWPLGTLLTLAALNIHLSQGWGSAFYTLPGIVGFHLGVEWLRHRWGIEVKPKPSASDLGRDQ